MNENDKKDENYGQGLTYPSGPTTRPAGKDSVVERRPLVEDDSAGQYVGPDGADGAGHDDETYESFMKNVEGPSNPLEKPLKPGD